MNLNELRTRVQKNYSFKKLLSDYLCDNQIFPLRIPLPRISSQDVSQHFTRLREEFAELAKLSESWGMMVTYASVSHRQKGTQSVPEAIIISRREIYLQLIQKESEFQEFQQSWSQIQGQFPTLRDFFLRHPLKILDHKDAWRDLLKVCHFLLQNPSSGLHLRQIDVESVDTKFIEKNKKILMELIQFLKGEKAHPVSDFETLYGLRQEAPRLRFRLLDQNLVHNYHGLHDIETTLTALQENPLPVKRVFIVENKVTGLTFPSSFDSAVFFELGYKALLLKDLSWLHQCEFFYWGDIDTHGFSILSQLRAYFPHIQSLLMDTATLLNGRSFWVEEQEPFLGECPHLKPEENHVFDGLKKGLWGPRLRLEQERISIAQLQKTFHFLNNK